MFSKNFRVRDFKKIKINGKLKKYYKSFLADSLNKKNLLNSFIVFVNNLNWSLPHDKFTSTLDC